MPANPRRPPGPSAKKATAGPPAKKATAGPPAKKTTASQRTVRHAVERRSVAALLVLHRLPRWIVPLLMVALFLVGMAVSGPVGVLALAALLTFTGWLSYLSWPAVDGRGRTVRLVLLGLLTALVVLRVR